MQIESEDGFSMGFQQYARGIDGLKARPAPLVDTPASGRLEKGFLRTQVPTNESANVVLPDQTRNTIMKWSG